MAIAVLCKVSFGSVEHHDDTDFEEENEEDIPMIAKEQQSAPREAITTMGTTAVNSLET